VPVGIGVAVIDDVGERHDGLAGLFAQGDLGLHGAIEEGRGYGQERQQPDVEPGDERAHKAEAVERDVVRQVRSVAGEIPEHAA
jgi:hypothetical protein